MEKECKVFWTPVGIMAGSIDEECNDVTMDVLKAAAMYLISNGIGYEFMFHDQKLAMVIRSADTLVEKEVE